MHLPTLEPATDLPEDARLGTFYDPDARVTGFFIRLGQDKALWLPLETVYPCPPVDRALRVLGYAWGFAMIFAVFYRLYLMVVAG